MQLIIATTSRHKQSEIAGLLHDLPLQVLSLRDFAALPAPAETGATMRENARLKAEYYATALQSLVLADDSGLEVDALDGAPGVRSARWIEGSDADRTRALLEKLREVPPENRSARYRCARYRCALCLCDGRESSSARTLLEVEATCEGRIAQEPRGENGFGYDPVFELTAESHAGPQWIGKTLAEAPPEIKAQISHRAWAIQLLIPRIVL